MGKKTEHRKHGTNLQRQTNISTDTVGPIHDPHLQLEERERGSDSLAVRHSTKPAHRHGASRKPLVGRRPAAASMPAARG